MLVWIIEMQINQIVTQHLPRKMGKSRGWKTSQRGDIVDAGTILSGLLCSTEKNKNLAGLGKCEGLPAEPLKKLGGETGHKMGKNAKKTKQERFRKCSVLK